ncbi:unnamed protein product [Amoebophrya sp. A120]|nr:unnamed protein product [Amoebophrya sp. A120]|eukprot:GSA120T00024244001.1
MLILSWNVAGWGPTHQTICAHFGSLENYLENHGCDVLCIQESKVSSQKASEITTHREAFQLGLEVREHEVEVDNGGVTSLADARGGPAHLLPASSGTATTTSTEAASSGTSSVEKTQPQSISSTIVDTHVQQEQQSHSQPNSSPRRKWSSFFAFNKSKNKRLSGFNGVGCFVRTDRYPVYAATQKVFNDPELDDEGRALLLDFGKFRLLNIYAPFANSPDVTVERQRFKLKFLQKLEARYLRTVKQEQPPGTTTTGRITATSSTTAGCSSTSSFTAKGADVVPVPVQLQLPQQSNGSSAAGPANAGQQMVPAAGVEGAGGDMKQQQNKAQTGGNRGNKFFDPDNFTILCGDFNISYRKEDVKVQRRLLEVDRETGRVVAGMPADMIPLPLNVDQDPDDGNSGEEDNTATPGTAGVVGAGSTSRPPPMNTGKNAMTGRLKQDNGSSSRQGEGQLPLQSTSSAGQPKPQHTLGTISASEKNPTRGLRSTDNPVAAPPAAHIAANVKKDAVVPRPKPAGQPKISSFFSGFPSGTTGTAGGDKGTDGSLISGSQNIFKGAAGDEQDVALQPQKNSATSTKTLLEQNKVGRVVETSTTNSVSSTSTTARSTTVTSSSTSSSSSTKFLTVAAAMEQSQLPLSAFRAHGLARHLRFEQEAVRWLQKLLRTKCADLFDVIYGRTARDRFTCWNQFTSERVESNNGSRIDLILVSKPLLARYLRPAGGGAAAGEMLQSQNLLEVEKDKEDTISRRGNSIKSIMYDVGFLDAEEAKNLDLAEGVQKYLAATKGSPLDHEALGSTPVAHRSAAVDSEDCVQESCKETGTKRTATAPLQEHPPVYSPLPLDGHFVYDPRISDVRGPFTEEQAAHNAATCFGGWHGLNRFASQGQRDESGQKDDMRLNNSQFSHNFETAERLQLRHWARVGNSTTKNKNTSSGEGLQLQGRNHKPDERTAADHTSTSSPRDLGGPLTRSSLLQKKRHLASIIYTPPSYSDHTMISLLLPDEVYDSLPNKPCGLSAAQTRETHPWRNQTRSMLSFLGGGGKRSGAGVQLGAAGSVKLVNPASKRQRT